MNETMAKGVGGDTERPTYKAPNKDSAEHGDQNRAQFSGLRHKFHHN